jgi:hypothetical protein
MNYFEKKYSKIDAKSKQETIIMRDAKKMMDFARNDGRIRVITIPERQA